MLKNLIVRLSSLGDLALSLLRIMLGIVLVAHGYGKVTHGFAVGFFANNAHIFLPQITGPFISLLELIGGICLIIGLFTRYLGVVYVIEFIVVMYVRLFTLHVGYHGSELELMILFTAVLLATNGGGRLSVDHSVRRWEP